MRHAYCIHVAYTAETRVENKDASGTKSGYLHRSAHNRNWHKRLRIPSVTRDRNASTKHTHTHTHVLCNSHLAAFFTPNRSNKSPPPHTHTYIIHASHRDRCSQTRAETRTRRQCSTHATRRETRSAHKNRACKKRYMPSSDIVCRTHSHEKRGVAKQPFHDMRADKINRKKRGRMWCSVEDTWYAR